MKDSDILELLHSAEMQFSVENIVEQGIYLWPALRIMLYNENWAALQTKNGVELSIGKKLLKNFIDPICFYFIAKLKDAKKNTRISPCQVVFLSYSLNRRVIENTGTYLDIFTDVLARELTAQKIPWLALERCPNGIFRHPRSESSVVISLMNFKDQIKTRFTQLPKLSSETQGLLLKVSSHLQRNGLLTSALTELSIQRLIRYLNVHSLSYEKMLKKCCPKRAVLTDWYSVNSLAFVLACKKQKVQVADYQHGVQGKMHVAYGRWGKPFSSGFSLIPDIFLTWTVEDAKNINSWLPDHQGQAFCIGNRFFDQIASGKIQLDRTEISKLLDLRKLNGPLKYGLLTLQPVYVLNKQIIAQIDLWQDQVFWLIRLHPNQEGDRDSIEHTLKQRFPRLKYNIIEASRAPLPELLKICDFHITFNSTVVMEASWLKIPSIILDPDLGGSYYSAIIDKGRAVVGVQTEIPNWEMHDDNDRGAKQTLVDALNF